MLDTFVKAEILKSSFDIGDNWTDAFNLELTSIEAEYVAG